MTTTAIDDPLVAVGPTWRLVGELTDAGVSRSWIVAQLGLNARTTIGSAFGGRRIRRSRADAVAEMHRLWRNGLLPIEAGGRSSKGEWRPVHPPVETLAPVFTLLAAIGQRSGWRTRAACAPLHPNVFHPAAYSADLVRYPKAVCARCPVHGHCADEHADEPHGVFFGTTPAERGQARVKKATPAGPEAWHGSEYGYTRGCRCDACRAAKREANAARRAS